MAAYTTTARLRDCLTSVLFLLVCGTFAPAAATPQISAVRHEPAAIAPGEEVRIAFLLDRDARISLLVLSPNFDVVRHLATDLPRSRGLVTFTWDGRDDDGRPVPDEAYLYEVRAVAGDGAAAVVNPALEKGGGRVDVDVEMVSRDDGAYTLNYRLAQPSRVAIMAGVHQGPMLRTILDWKPRSAGSHTLVWNGRDATGRLEVMAQTGGHVLARAFALPPNAVIVTGGIEDYAAYSRAATGTATTATATDFAQFRQAALDRSAEGITPQYLVPPDQTMVPAFTVYAAPDYQTGAAEKPSVPAAGDLELLFEILPDHLDRFNETRFELVVFVDNQRFDEEEQVYSPYTYLMDTRSLSEGLHSVTVNLVSIDGFVGAYTFTVNVRSEVSQQ